MHNIWYDISIDVVSFTLHGSEQQNGWNEWKNVENVVEFTYVYVQMDTNKEIHTRIQS